MHSKEREDEHQGSTNEVHTLRKLNLSSKVDHSHLPLASTFFQFCVLGLVLLFLHKLTGRDQQSIDSRVGR